MEKGKQTYKLPVGWVLVKLENISKQITDGSHNPPKSIDSGVPMLSARNIENGNMTFPFSDDVDNESNLDYHIEGKAELIIYEF